MPPKLKRPEPVTEYVVAVRFERRELIGLTKNPRMKSGSPMTPDLEQYANGN